MSRVIFDSQVFIEQRHGGVSRYFSALAAHLLDTPWTPFIARGVSPDPLDLAAGIQDYGPRLPLPRVDHTFRARRRINSLLMRAYRPRPDGESVYHPTWYHGPSMAAWGSLPIVLTIHDLIPEKWPGVTSPSQLIDRREAIRKARAIVCVSESTQAELGVHYPGAVAKSQVTLLGMSDLAGKLEPPSESPRPYFVHIGKRGAYKDFATIVRALAITPADVQVVAAGGGPQSEYEEAMLAGAGLESRVRFEPDASDGALAQLLDGSQGLISASREEGFGLPALEALARGRPVILSDIPVYRELFGKWGRFFAPGDHEALASVVLEVLDKPPLQPSRSDLEATFSWTETARITATAYDRAVS